MHRCAPVRFVRRTASQSSCFMRTASPSRVIAALFTKISSRPNFSRICLKPAFTCSASATSILTANAVPPAAVILATTAASFSALRDATPTLAPASASASAVSRPIPCEAPVTKATLSFRLNIQAEFSLCSLCSDLCELWAKSFELRRVSTSLRNLIDRRRQTLFIFHIQCADTALNLPQQSDQHSSRPHLHKSVHA